MLPQTIGWAVLLTAIAASGGAELELVDGRVIAGVEVRREGAEYILVLETGATISLPVELVKRVRLFGEGDDEDAEDDDRKSRTLAGDADMKAPTVEQQLEVFGEPSRFQKSGIDSSWTPKSDWNMDPETQNNFRPSTWQESPIDPTWKPTSDWDNNADVLKDSRSTWQKSSRSSEWKPTDGFATSPSRSR